MVAGPYRMVRGAVLVTGMALGAVACTSGTAPTGATTPSASIARSATPATTASSATQIRVDLPVTRTIRVAEAVAATFEAAPTSVTLSPTADPRISFLGLNADGKILAVRVPQEPAGSRYDRVTVASDVGFWEAGHFTAVASSGRETQGTLRGRQRQITAVAQSGDQLVWAETPSADLNFNEWSIRAVDLRSHRVREIAHSPVLSDGARLLDVFGGTYPVVLGDWVYWASAVPNVKSPDPDRVADWEFDLQRAALARPSPVQTIARNAVMPAGLDDALVYASYDSAKADVYEIHRRDVNAGGADRVLARGYRSGTSWITNLAASGKLVVWTAQSPSLAKEGWVPGESVPGDLFVLDTSTGSLTRVVTKDEAGGNGSIAFTRRGVAWGNGSGSGDAGEYVLDTSTGAIQRLGQQEGLSEVLATPTSDELLWVADIHKGNNIVWKRATLR